MKGASKSATRRGGARKGFWCADFEPITLSDRSDRFLVECATLASRECAGPGPSISLLCTWFRQRVSTALQRSLAHAIHARTLCLEQSMALVPPPPPRVPLSFSELRIVASFV